MGKVLNRNFEKFFKANFSSVYVFMKHYTGDSELAADLTQEAFVRLLEYGDEIILEKYGKAYLYTVARRLYWHHCRHQKAEENYISRLNENNEDDYNLLKEITRQETIQVLRVAINKLPPKVKQIILLNLEGKSNAEVGELLQISLNTVKDLKKSAYVVLRKLLSKDYFIFLLWLTQG